MQLSPGTWPQVGLLGAVALVGGLLDWRLGMLLAVPVPLVIWFHRDPDRAPPAAGVIAPADGRISVVDRTDGHTRIGTFMNVTDVHVNRAPVTGTVTAVTHRPGANRPAFSKDSARNERVEIDIETHRGVVQVVLIAGWFARRIHPYVTEGQRVQRGERIGHISYGSRADVVLADGAEPAVQEGTRVRAGESVLIERS
ncbi:MAG: protein sorting system archaetidylserine decarboxylase [Haloquadratum sp.]|mgnify:CR=1 FL=1|jgi:phosphatidylserine decarboxylase|nr:protein sorting system archaetidylserine decarboxylase [Haloferacaceae archaeon]MDR9445535.1 protein sorting system archaetidylserine decarboxylase [Haloquadratum sp.]